MSAFFLYTYIGESGHKTKKIKLPFFAPLPIPYYLSSIYFK